MHSTPRAATRSAPWRARSSSCSTVLLDIDRFSSVRAGLRRWHPDHSNESRVLSYNRRFAQMWQFPTTSSRRGSEQACAVVLATGSRQNNSSTASDSSTRIPRGRPGRESGWRTAESTIGTVRRSKAPMAPTSVAAVLREHHRPQRAQDEDPALNADSSTRRRAHASTRARQPGARSGGSSSSTKHSASCSRRRAKAVWPTSRPRCSTTSGTCLTASTFSASLVVERIGRPAFKGLRRSSNHRYEPRAPR